MTHDPTLDARLWRAVSALGDLADAVARLTAALAEHGVERVALVRVDREPPRLVTLAGPGPARAARDRDTARPVLRLLDAAAPARLEAPLARALHLTAPATAAPLAVDGDPVIALLAPPPAPAVVTAALAPLAVAVDNDRRLHALTRTRDALAADREALLTRLQRHDIAEVVIGERGGLQGVMARVGQVAPTDAPVLILGETGAGKEVIARAIHARSRRHDAPVVRVNCGAIPAELIDSELFGHERGAFTGAVTARQGWFERADGGTLFLDEIGELPMAAQVRLLRVLQDGTLERVGGGRTLAVDVRIVAATHRHLEGMVAEGRFREDLWYRLCVFPIRLPALRERMEDLPALAAHFADRAGRRLGGLGLAPTPAELALLAGYAWPGNVRELAAVIERAVILGNGRRLELAAALGATTPRPAPVERAPAPLDRAPPEPIGALDAAIAAHIERALAACRGRIEGPFGAAHALGVNPHTLRARMRKLGVDWARFRG
ncbi:MAG: sigma-54-dependent Fis family transcriptional regulator [Myxococcales bacterium]|nr:sigma-54-dependent Fis family transcriptional regulator [Myxococcales bacterium]